MKSVLRYWRTSLADGALGEGRFSRRNLNGFIKLPDETLRSGIIPPDMVEQLFKGDNGSKPLSIRFWPMVFLRPPSHGIDKADDLPDVVAPIVTSARVDYEGVITPIKSTIARNVLTPLPADDFSIGSIDDLDSYLATAPDSYPDGMDWEDYLQSYRNMLDAVAKEWRDVEAEYKPGGYGLMVAAEDSSGAVRNILQLYDYLLKKNPDTPLLSRISQGCPAELPTGNAEKEIARRLGHSNPHFPLTEQQREVLASLDVSKPGDVIAVNGPPGTGKTTMVLSAVAGLWVKAALAGGNPPVIVAASANNQAVTNIIDAFGKDFAEGTGPFKGRWIPALSSYGIFLPAMSRMEEAQQKYQTDDFQTRMETVEAYQKAKAAWLAAARSVFPQERGDTAEFVARLQALMHNIVQDLQKADEAVAELSAITAEIAAQCPDVPHALREAETRMSAADEDLSRLQRYKSAFEQQQAAESAFLAFFDFIPAVRQKRLLRARLALKDIMGLERFTRLSELSEHLHNQLDAAQRTADTAKSTLKRLKLLHNKLQAALDAETAALNRLGGRDGLEDRLDRGPRFELFRLATHYWEGRWLQAMEEDLAEITSSARKRGKATLVPRWHRRMMLTPCAVATFASLPNRLSYSRMEGDKWATEYLCDFVDLLIVDEAGQTLPEIGGAAFALAKRALVIGDTRQIEPISSVPKAVDFGNLRSEGLVETWEDLPKLQETGICSNTGSVMHLAQQACRHSPWPDLGRGLWLFEHRRCFDDIISYSNALCYKGRLRPMRGAATPDAVLPALGYLHVDGRALRVGNSRSNPTEAKTIAAWIAAHRGMLEARYGCPVERIVGIVTPFGAQVRALQAACAAEGITVSNSGAITIGTVHALQGAERPVVLFSQVYSRHADGGFIDSSPSMLNVTLSRAKDSFIFFGDMELLAAAPPGSPRALLSDFLDKPEQEIAFEICPRSDLLPAGVQLQGLRDAAEHDAFLINALQGKGRNYLIVSPWVRLPTMEKRGILTALEDAAARGAVIDIFADPLLNADCLPNGQTQLEAAESRLSQSGISVHRLHKLHSKIVAVDTEILCAGSFNWLSAHQEGQYARHETSYVYRGAQVESEIDMIRKGLSMREK